MTDTTQFGTIINDYIEKKVDDVLKQKQMPDEIVYVQSDNLGEIIEKLIILHIRTWMLEDVIQAATTDAEIADIKRKLDICFKVKRPNLVQSINILVDEAIKHNKSLREDSVKLYKGVKE
jgi:hypothetical protein